MKKKAFTLWVRGVGELSGSQLARLKAAIEEKTSAPAVSQTIDEQPPTACPHCQSHTFHKFGFQHELQRYRCKACRKSFNRLTGTALARLRKKGQWLGVVESLGRRETLDQMQERLGVSRTTAVRWRKRFLTVLQPSVQTVLSGIVEADETFVRRGQKGTVCVERPARKRAESATPGGTQLEDYICVLVARDRNKQVAHHLPESQKTAVFEEFLNPLIAPDSILCTDGLTGYSKFAQKANIQHVVLRANRREYVKAGVYHIQNVNAYHSRVQEFLRRCKGVAAKNLQFYLGWVDHLDRLSDLAKPLNPKQVFKTFALNS